MSKAVSLEECDLVSEFLIISEAVVVDDQQDQIEDLEDDHYEFRNRLDANHATMVQDQKAVTEKFDEVEEKRKKDKKDLSRQIDQNQLDQETAAGLPLFAESGADVQRCAARLLGVVRCATPGVHGSR